MVYNTKATVNSINNPSKTLYGVGIGANLVISLGHIIYTFVVYEKPDEPALWFFSGALTMIFNAGLNFLCLRECSSLIFSSAMFSNFALLLFSIALAIAIREMQTVVLIIVTGYITLMCYVHMKHIRKSEFDENRSH